MTEEKTMSLSIFLQKYHDVTISDVFVKENITFFTAGEEKFCTYHHYVYHSSDVLYDHKAAYAMAKHTETIDGQIEGMEMEATSNEKLELFGEHKNEFYTMIIMTAMSKLGAQGRDAMVEYIERMISPYPEEDGFEMLRQIHKARGL